MRCAPFGYHVSRDDNEPLSGLVEPLDAEPLVELGAVGGVGVVKATDHVAGLRDNGAELVLGDRYGPGGAQLGALGLGDGLLGGRLVDPRGDRGRVAAGVQGGAVVGELR